MFRRASAYTLVLALVTLVGPPANAKGPTQVEVHDLRTGSTTLLSTVGQGEIEALGYLVGWPESKRVPRGVRTGQLTHIATLTWQIDDETPFWVDRVYSDDAGGSWVGRRDHASGSRTVTWSRISAFAFDAVLSAIQAPDTETTSPPPPAAAILDAPPGPSRSGTAGFDPASFGWGAGLTAVVATCFILFARRRFRSSRPDPTL